MYINSSRYDGFIYNNISYHSGTKAIFNGKCFADKTEMTLINQPIVYLYTEKTNVYFQHNDIVYHCNSWDFKNRIVKIIVDTNIPTTTTTMTTNKTEVFYWTDDMITKTMWYVVIMIVATLFHARVALWILVTIIWYTSTFKNNQ